MFSKAVDFNRRSKPFPRLWSQNFTTSGFLPVFNPGPTIQFLGPIVPRLLSHEPVVLSDCVRIHPRLILPTVPTLRSNATVENGIEAVDSLRSQIPRKRLDEHSLRCLGCCKPNSHWLSTKSSSRSGDSNNSFTPCRHLWPHMLGHREESVHICLHGHLQFLVGDILVGCKHSIASIVDHCVDLTQLLLDCSESGFEGLRVGDIS